MLKLMYITNNPRVAKIAEEAGVDRIFIDMEYMGKDERQGGMDTVKNHHTVEDIKNIRSAVTKAQILVRVNPIHKNTPQEIDAAIDAGADLLMLPMWKTAEDVKAFINCVNKRAGVMLLLENRQAAESLDEALKLDGIDEIHIGLNDLHLSLKKDFLFELLADGTVEGIVNKIKKTNIPYGFGGFGRLGDGILNADYIVAEHYRLGSSIAILSRAFCNAEQINDLSVVEDIFKNGVAAIREFEDYLASADDEYFAECHCMLCDCCEEIVRRKSGSIKHLKDFWM